ncbi:MAG: hypothetical protein JO135_10440 [Candidatus Eremiobacteraeota bacterium]|nr:hypothetical protein [Candidatus Eremiobacteraeota bacterium]
MKKTIALVTLAMTALAFAGCSAGGGALIPATQQMQAQGAHGADSLGGLPAPNNKDSLGGLPGPNNKDSLGGLPTGKDSLGGLPGPVHGGH